MNPFSRTRGMFRSGSQSEKNARSAFLTEVGRLEHFVWLLNRLPSHVPPPLQLSPGTQGYEDQSLIARVMASYRRAVQSFTPTDGFWDVWHLGLKKPIHEALSGSDVSRAAAVLRDPASNVLFWGFDAISRSPGEPEPHELVLRRLSTRTDWRHLYALWLCDGLLSLAEAVGARRTAYPEIDVDTTLVERETAFDVDATIDTVERETGTVLNFPNPFPNELGLPSKRGIIGFRAIQSVYQGWRISQLARGNPNFKVLEIGAGLGRTAYFARLFGVKNYTLVDVPLTNAAQGYFLGRVLGDKNVLLPGELGSADLRIVANEDLEAISESYDLIANVDSWTEMPRDVGQRYWDFARKNGSVVLSINHEYNPGTVREFYRDENGARVLRYPYPLRRGYVEEIITLGH